MGNHGLSREEVTARLNELRAETEKLIRLERYQTESNRLDRILSQGLTGYHMLLRDGSKNTHLTVKDTDLVRSVVEQCKLNVDKLIKDIEHEHVKKVTLSEEHWKYLELKMGKKKVSAAIAMMIAWEEMQAAHGKEENPLPGLHRLMTARPDLLNAIGELTRIASNVLRAATPLQTRSKTKRHE